MDHHHLALLIDTTIETSTLSDHAPITLKLKIPSIPHKTTNWKLNDLLISEEIDKKMINDELQHYFRDNSHPEISPGTLWEAHKAFIRGKFIELGSRKKRERLHQQSELIHEIADLERQHKSGLSLAVFNTLSKKGEELKTLLHLDRKRQFRIVAQCLHE